MTRYFLPPRNVRPSHGNVSPAKFEPPPAQPMMTSGSSPAISSWAIDSWPMTVWWRRTKSNTEPSEYFVPGWVTVSSIASLIATPSEPVWLGFSSRTLRP